MLELGPRPTPTFVVDLENGAGDVVRGKKQCIRRVGKV